MQKATIQSLQSNKWSIACGVLFLAAAFGCVKTTPTLPEKTVPNTTPVGLIDLRASDAPPTIVYQQPPKGFVDGFFRGAQHGAVLGGHVGYELAKTIIMTTPRRIDVCQGKQRFGRHAGNCALANVAIVPIVSLMALVATPTITTPTVAIQEGFTAYSKAEAQAWRNALSEAQDRLQIQNTFRDHVARSISACCYRHLPEMATEPLASVERSGVTSSPQADTILQTEVLELGLAEASSELVSEPDSNDSSVTPAMAVAPLNQMFKMSRSSVYMLVRGKLLRAHDNSLIDQRDFGYLSVPHPYFEWSTNGASLFRNELAAAYQSLAAEISYALVQRAPFPLPDALEKAK